MAKKQILDVGVTMPIPHDENLETKMLNIWHKDLIVH